MQRIRAVGVSLVLIGTVHIAVPKTVLAQSDESMMDAPVGDDSDGVIDGFASMFALGGGRGFIKQPPGSNWCGFACIANATDASKRERERLMRDLADQYADDQGIGSSADIPGIKMQDLADLVGWDVVPLDKDKLRDLVSRDVPIIIARTPKEGSSIGHFIVLTDVSKDGNLYSYVDPADGKVHSIDIGKLDPKQGVIPPQSPASDAAPEE
ncbi:MAG: papain-like cysteine protease family protein [Bdellovibrionota bacterium]